MDTRTITEFQAKQREIIENQKEIACAISRIEMMLKSLEIRISMEESKNANAPEREGDGWFAFAIEHELFYCVLDHLKKIGRTVENCSIIDFLPYDAERSEIEFNFWNKNGSDRYGTTIKDKARSIMFLSAMNGEYHAFGKIWNLSILLSGIKSKCCELRHFDE